MSAVKASLIAVALLAFPQAGGVDDLAELFPEDTALFAEVGRVSALLRDWREHASAYLPAAKRKELLEKLEKASREGLDRVPELLRKDLEKLAPTLQRAAVGVSLSPDGPRWALAASSSDPALFRKIVDEDLKVFTSEEKAHAGVTARLIRRLGDVPLPDGGVWFAAAGRRLVASSQWASVAAMLDRAAGRAAGTDLRANPTYRSFAATPGDGASFRAFLAGVGSLFDGFSMGFGRRSSSHEMDKVNAFLGLDKIGGFLVEASIHPGRVSSTARLRIASPCPLYEAWRQPAGPKDALKFLPADAGLTAHVNAKGGKALLADLRKLMARYDEIEAVASPPEAPNLRRARPMDARSKMDREFERELGVTPDELFGAIGGEAAFGLVGPSAFALDPGMVGALLFVVKAADPATAPATLKKIVAKLGQYETKDVDGVVFHLPAEKGELPAFAWKGDTCLIGGSKEALELALAAEKSGKHAAAGLPADAAKASKLISADLGAFWRSIAGKMGGELPEEARGLDFEARSLVMFEEAEDELRLRAADGGTGFALQAGWMAAPLFVFGMSRGMRAGMRAGFEEAPAEAPPPVEGPPLPLAELEARVQALSRELAADELDKREEAAGKLRALGRQAVPGVVAAYKAASDAESKGRLLGLLMEWKAYDALPEALAKKIDAFLQGFRRPPNPNDARRMMMDMGVQWYRHDGMPWTYCMEPSWVNEASLKATPHVDVLRFEAGAKAAAEAAASEATPVEQRRKLASLLAFLDCGQGGDGLLEARDAARDPEVKSYLQIALGWSSTPRCRAALLAGFKDADVWTRRSSFIAAERSTDPAVAGRLVELLKDADPETRWNATYTLKLLTKRRVAVNVYAPKAEVEEATAAAAAWWAKNKDTFTPGK